MAGGRYDGLIETMGGPATPGVGWASGVERLAMLLAKAPAAPRPIVVVPVGEAAQATALKVLQELRHAGHVVEMGYSGNLKKRLQRANKMNARAALLFGDEELAAGSAPLRDLDSGEQELVSLDRLAEHLSLLSSRCRHGTLRPPPGRRPSDTPAAARCQRAQRGRHAARPSFCRGTRSGEARRRP
jgi:histidyl-tRNA synthetase